MFVYIGVGVRNIYIPTCTDTYIDLCMSCASVVSEAVSV
jgi:hypothetical protein